jgi:hydrogenase maturation factor
VRRDGKLALDAPTSRTDPRQIEGRGFADHAQVGDWVSVHWGWACEVLSQTQKAQMERHTRHNLAIANQTI